MNLAIANSNDLVVEGFMPSLTMISGMSGMGKSTAAATWPQPVAFAFDENGLRYLTVQGDDGEYQLPRIEVPVEVKNASGRTRVEQMGKFIRAQVSELAKDNAHTFKSVLVDTIDDMYNLFRDAYMWDKGLTEFNAKDHTAPLTDLFLPVLQAIFGLVTSGYHVVLVAHTAEKDAEVGSLPVHTLLLPQKLADKIFSRVDQGFFIAPGAISKEAAAESAKNPDEISGVANRFLTKATGRHPSKDRSARLPKFVPATFGAINAAFAGENPEAFQPTISGVQPKMIRTKGAAYWQSRKK